MSGSVDPVSHAPVLVDEIHDIKAAVARLARACHSRGWAPATSGNFSARAGAHIAITGSGHDKGNIDARHVLLVDHTGQPAEISTEKPSAETALHLMLYRHDPRISWVVHTHSVPSVVLSRRAMAAAGPHTILLHGFELTKAFTGVTTHDHPINVPVIANSQDMTALAAAAEARLDRSVPAFLVAGHGAYSWGGDLAECARHVEALETLLACVLEETRMS
jgi:methylthioribulose-1-phosphate dehydratase